MIDVYGLQNLKLNDTSRIEASIPRRIDAPKRTIHQEAFA
jgi:hypothetical protein